MRCTLEGMFSNVHRAGANGVQLELDQAASRWQALSPRLREAAELVGRGFSNRQVAEQMGISQATVERVYLPRLRERLQVEMGLRGRMQIARQAAILEFLGLIGGER